MAHGRFDNPIVAALAGVKDFFGKQDLADRLSDDERMDGKTVIITGANSGLGFGLSIDMAKRGAKVIMACRRQIPEAGEAVKVQSGADHVEMRHLDLSKIDSIHAFCEGLEQDEVSVDILVLNAGVALPTSRKTDSGLEEMFLVNYLANVVLTSRLLKTGVIPNATYAKNGEHPTPRIIFVSSDSHQGSSYVDHEQFGTFEEYGVTKGMNYYSYYKLVLNTYATELSRRLSNGQLDVANHVICPGPVNSNIIKEAPWALRVILKGIFSVVFKSPLEAAKPVTYLSISADYEGKTNEYLHMFNPKRMDAKVYEEAEGKKLWDHSIEVWKRHDPLAERFVLEASP
ncbi:MAG: SDR family NAD(P)-dependent oxidoreductase [Bacteroidota bacterium]